ncbi:S-adenosyl-L-methionine-dependent methyltransferase [Cyathus striatus]|nr:S-adenosyl-L-methionine-dependent methyltransferase [Cyathus striatus]
MDELESLRNTFNLAIDALQDELRTHQLPSLSTSALDPHPIDRADFDCPPRLYEARKLALATMGQIRNLIQRPYERVSDQSGAALQASGLDILIKTGIVAKLNNAPDPAVGLSVKALGNDLDLDSSKLTTILRYMAAQGWLRETSEGVFALTRLALELREGQLGWKWAMYPCLTKVSAATLDQITHKDHEYRYSRSPNQAAFQLAYNTDKTVFAYMKEHPDELKLFANAIQAIGDAYQTSIESDFPWIKYDSYKFVDVGGGKGNLSIMLVKKLPKAQFVVQDLEEIVKLAQANIKDKVHDPNQQCRIAAITHNFFELQPVVGLKHVYLLRYILHDWPDDDCIKILKSIVDVADPSAKILIVEVVAAPCSTSSEEVPNGIQLDDLKDAVGYTPISPPPFIPKNFGSFANGSLSLGYHMLGLLNSLERTGSEWEIMLAKANIKIDAIHPLRGMLSVIECGIKQGSTD